MNFLKKIIISLYFGITSYFLIAPIFGERGLLKYTELEESLNLMKIHINNLKETQKFLKSKYISLRVSKPEIFKEAGIIQYYPKNSIVIKLEERQKKPKYYQGGVLETTILKNKSEDKNFYIISIVMAFISYFTLSYIYSIKKEFENK